MKDLINSLETMGVSLFLLNGDLKLSAPKGTITHDILAELKSNKDKIIQALQNVSDEHEGRRGTLNPSCWYCYHYDGAGSSWPGMCRYFEQLGQEVKEIDTKTIDPDKGCRFFMDAAQKPIVAPQSNNNNAAKPTPIKQEKEPRPRIKLPSPVALAWLADNKEALISSGWTKAEIYRRNKSKRGIAWLPIWQRSDLDVSMQSNGVIRFYFKDRGISQSATPRKNIINGAQ